MDREYFNTTFLKSFLYEMTTMKNLTKEEREKEKEKKKKKDKKRKIGDIDLDDILKKNKEDDLDELFKKYNISKEDFEKKILNDTANHNKTNVTSSDKEENKKETDL